MKNGMGFSDGAHSQSVAPGAVRASPGDQPQTDPWERLTRHRELIFRICLGLCRNSSDAKDMTQETYCKALSRRDVLEKLINDEHLKLWLCKIARNCCLDHLRRAKWRALWRIVLETRPSGGCDPEAHQLHSERITLLHQALTQLPRRQRDVLILREYGQFSYREISLLLGIREGTIMSILLRARRRVHASIQEALRETI
jgi:RNA polymerase sigma-70 factor, ECF subfamily